MQFGLDRFILYGTDEEPTDSSREDMIEAMWSMYSHNLRRASFEVDWDTMEKIHDGINTKEETDLIKRRALELVVWQIEETYKNNTGEEYKNLGI